MEKLILEGTTLEDFYKHVAGIMEQQLAKYELKQKSKIANFPTSGFITAMEFMNAVKIKRTKFDELVSQNKIKIVKKKRKIYVQASEIDRYFNDGSIL